MLEFGSTAAQPVRVHFTAQAPYEGIAVFEFSGDLIHRFTFIGRQGSGS